MKKYSFYIPKTTLINYNFEPNKVKLVFNKCFSFIDFQKK